MTPGTYDFIVQRNAPYLETLDFEGFNFTGATIAMQVRDYVAAEGSALLTLAAASAGSQGVSVTTTTTGGIVTSHLLFQIDEATIDALRPWPANGQKARSDAVVLYYDLIMTGGGLGKTRWLEGRFIIREGVTV